MKIAILVLSACCGCLAQTPAFDVASIRLNTLDQRNQIETSPDSFTARNENLKTLVQWAYDMPPFQVTGPAALDGVRFNVVAKAARPVDESQLRLMLQTLLAERFGMKAHVERKEMQIYELAVAKNGLKLRESATQGQPVFSNGKGTLLAERVSLRDLASKISEPLGRPVIDTTGDKRRYDVKIDITAYASTQGEGGGNLDVMAVLFKAIPDQLGLSLTSRKDTVDILVVDHTEKEPTEN